MKILVEHGGYPLNNLGDLAMLQVAIDRIRKKWDNASISVFTTAPEKLERYCYGTTFISPEGKKIWGSPLIGLSHKILSDSNFQNKWIQIEWWLRTNAPLTTYSYLNNKLERNYPELSKNLETVMEAVINADLVIATGGGYITDAFRNHALSVMRLLELANKLKKTTAMFGQGIAPLHDKELINQARRTLPKLDFISLREQKTSLPLLEELGVHPSRILVTGDDAIELSYDQRNNTLGSCIGINLRWANYSGMSDSYIEDIRQVIQEFASSRDISLTPIPISLKSDTDELSDIAASAKIIGDYRLAIEPVESLDTPLGTIEQVKKCRLVITGSYHAGVFALSQGIPVIGLAASEYYASKFLGLGEQFEGGCRTILLNEHDFHQSLSRAIREIWDSAERIRPLLLEAAIKQVQLGHLAYQKVLDLV